MKLKNVRLARYIKPERYEIMLHPDLKLFTFRGEETISLLIQKSTKNLTFHAKELKIHSAELSQEGNVFPAKQVILNPKDETVTLKFQSNVPRGRVRLKLKFTGVLNDKMRGFYRSRYHVGGEERYMATTQFEATDARRAFPCFDEPAAKAVFDVTLIVPRHMEAISNTIPVEVNPVTAAELSNFISSPKKEGFPKKASLLVDSNGVKEHAAGYKIVKFAPTPKMSTYLVAFIVGEFDYIEKKNAEGVLVRVFVTPGKKEQARFALDVAAKVLSFFTKYFGISYPLPVLDMIAIPDFTSGAMENWGAVTYREVALLVDPEHSSAANKQWVAIVVAHELAHQWFGNLVTMEWWTHLWLNEGFASYIEYLAVDYLFPGWDLWTQFVYQDLGAALSLDALKHTHPIEVRVHHPDEIGEIFDAVSYQKGSSVIRMLADYLGKRDFRDGLRHYLKKHQYANAETNDLWLAFEHVSGKPVRKIMQNWTRRGGYPVVTVENKKKGLALRQSRFFSSAISKREVKDPTIWQVPISYRTASDMRDKKVLLDRKTKEVAADTHTWIKLNYGVAGVYRVRYSPELLLRLKDAVTQKQLSARDRFSIQTDAFALAEAGESSVIDVLPLLEAYEKEDDYTVWIDIATNLGKLESLLRHESFLSHYERYARGIFTKIVSKMGWKKRKGEKHTDVLLRSLVLFNYGSYGDKPTVREAERIFRSSFHKNKIPADLRGVVYGLVAENGGEKEYKLFLERYKKESMHEEKNRLARALGCFKQKSLLKKTLQFAISNDVRPQDTAGVVAGVYANHQGTELAWEFVKKNWKFLVNRYDGGDHTLPRFIQPAAAFTTRKKAEDVREFFKKNPAPGAERAIEQVVEKICSNAEWLKRDGAKISKWLIEKE